MQYQLTILIIIPYRIGGDNVSLKILRKESVSTDYYYQILTKSLDYPYEKLNHIPTAEPSEEKALKTTGRPVRAPSINSKQTFTELAFSFTS